MAQPDNCPSGVICSHDLEHISKKPFSPRLQEGPDPNPEFCMTRQQWCKLRLLAEPEVLMGCHAPRSPESSDGGGALRRGEGAVAKTRLGGQLCKSVAILFAQRRNESSSIARTDLIPYLIMAHGATYEASNTLGPRAPLSPGTSRSRAALTACSQPCLAVSRAGLSQLAQKRRFPRCLSWEGARMHRGDPGAGARAG